MRKVRLYIAASLNGKITEKDGSVAWLDTIPNPNKDDYGYESFYSKIDTTIQGNATYQQIMSWGIPFPYEGKENYVLTRDPSLQDTEHVSFISEHPIEKIKALKEKEGKDIWLIGGGKINSLLLNAGLIDEMMVFLMPIVITEGVNLFEGLPKQTHLKLEESKTYDTGVVELRYSVE